MPLTSSRIPVRLLAAALLLASAAAAAKPPVEEPDNLLNDRFTLQAGLVSASVKTTVRFDSTAGTLGTAIDGEKDLGLPARKLIGRGELMFRMRDRHRIRIGNYFLPLDRRASTVLKKTVDFGDTTYNIDETVTSQLNMRLFAITYTYSIVKNDRVDLGASLGFDVVGFEAMASVPARLRTEREDRSAPAPLGGLEGAVRISSRFYGEARAQYLKVNVSNVRGTMKTYEANVLYRLMPNVTFGLGYSGFAVNVDSEKVGDSGRFDLKTNGPQLFVRVGF